MVFKKDTFSFNELQTFNNLYSKDRIHTFGSVLRSVASRHVSLGAATRVLPLGVLMGLLVPCMVWVQSPLLAGCLLMIFGAIAGFFVVPMNALLQHRGRQLLTAGRSIAVQGFNENLGMLVMLALYAGATAIGVSLALLMWCFGLLVACTMFVILLRHREQTRIVLQQ